MIHGKNFIGFELSSKGDNTFTAIDPAQSTQLEGRFYSATTEEVDQAVEKASTAFALYKNMTGLEKAAFLEQIAEEILALGDVLIQRAMAESGLPEGRITGERGRTIGQLRLFADLLREGSWVEAAIDTAEPERSPIPKPDIRKMLVPIGPVIVFGASNFPLAFSTAGGDTASALAAGNPIIVKGHNSHPGTSELVAGAILEAAKKTNMPDGVFSHLNDSGFEVGRQLVSASAVKAVAFTGSQKGGKALYDLAGQRNEPIPVFAEMGSINPVIILPGALENVEVLAQQYAASITLGSGQFCTNPGLLLGLESSKLDAFKNLLKDQIASIVPTTMLNEGIFKNYEAKKLATMEQAGVEVISASEQSSGKTSGIPLVASVSGNEFIANPKLHEEVFGPFSLLVVCNDDNQLGEIASSLEGQLTITIMGSEDDLVKNAKVIDTLTSKTGRIIFNGVPTGVEVCSSMQHGGPYPASTDSRFTSVGTGAIKRFVRPISFQNWPDSLLPAELQNSNPMEIWRLKDNNWNKN